MRTPSGPSTATKPYWPESRRHTTPAKLTRYTARKPTATRAVCGANWSSARQRGHGADEHEGDQREKDRADQRAQGDGGHRQAGVGRRSGVGVTVPGQQDEPELGCLGHGEVGQTSVGGTRAGQAHTQLGDTQQPGEQGAHDVDGLNAGEREAARVPADEPGLDAQRVALEAPAGHHPVDVAIDGRPERDDDEVVRLGRGVLGPGVHGGDEHQEHECRGQPADAGEWRQRVKPLPVAPGRLHRLGWFRRRSRLSRFGGRRLGSVGCHIPAAIASPSSVNRSRSRAASSVSRPGMRASLAAAAVCNLTVERWNRRSIGPAVTSTNCMRP